MDRKALIVEDEPHTGHLLAQILHGMGFQSTVLHEGKPAVPWVRENKPDLVLLDLMLPDISGYDICHQLKLDRHTNLIPIVIVTALVGHEDMIQGLKVGANYYITKPFGLEQLEHAVRKRRRVSVRRRGNEYIVVASAITSSRGREAFAGYLSMTGEELVFVLADLDHFQVLDL